MVMMIVMIMMIHRPNGHKDSQDLNTLFFRPAWNDDDDDDDYGNDDDDDDDGDDDDDDGDDNIA